MAGGSYNQFCPVAKACELLQPRWTLLILSEMWSGSTRFNDIHRGVPGMSPTLLSRRLKEMEAGGLVHHDATGYHSTAMAQKLEPIVHALGQWAHEAIRELSKKGTSIRQIVRQTGHSRKLVRDVLRGQRLDVFRTRPSSLDS